MFKSSIVHKFIVYTVLIILIAGFCTPALAAGETAQISREQAMEIAQKAFGIPGNLKNVDITYREEEFFGNRKFWDFNWNWSVLGSHRNIHVSIDADLGEVISYWESEDPTKVDNSAKPKTKEECRQIAEAFLQRQIPEKFNQSEPVDVPFPDYDIYNSSKVNQFYYQRQKNGLPFPDNTIHIGVNQRTGRITQYSMMWEEDLEFPEPEKVITLEQAEQILREKGGLRLAYLQPLVSYPLSSINSNKTVQLYYTTDDMLGFPSIIDAFSGKLIDNYGNEVEMPRQLELPENKGVTPTQKSENTLTLEEAKDKARQYVTIPADYVVHNSRFSEGWYAGSAKIWEFQFGSEGFGFGENIRITINAETGELVNYHSWDNFGTSGEEKPVNYDYEKCKQIAQNYLKRVIPNKAQSVYLREMPRQDYYYVNGKKMKTPSYSFSFVRVENGIPANMNNITIGINNNTGKVSDFWCSWDDDLNFVPKDNTISEKEAMDKLLADEKPALRYMRRTTEDGIPSKELMLVYTPYEVLPKIVNAKTGAVEDSYALAKSIQLKDIEGHWAEREIRLLGGIGVVKGNKDQKFYPDNAITRAEFVTMLSTAKGLEVDSEADPVFSDVREGAWYYNAVQAAATAGIIKGNGIRFNPEQPVTRQEIIVMLMNAAAIDMVSQLPEDMAPTFKDQNQISSWAKDAVLNAAVIGVISGTDGYMKPTRQATRAEAVVMLTKTLEVSFKN